MILVIGGNSQGKLDFVKEKFDLTDYDISDGGTCKLEGAFKKPVLNRLHLLIKRMTEGNIKPEDAALSGIQENPDIIIICDELGCGIVPVNAEERDFREQVGRIQCQLARKADKVFRVCCGIPILIKGE